MIFAIRGSDAGHLMSVTRSQPAGAALLAEHWLERGFTDVVIEWDGRSVDLADFEMQFALTRNGLSPRDRAEVVA